MNRLWTPLLAVALAAMLQTGPARAQENTDEIPTQKTTNQVVGDWTVTCATNESGTKSCAMMQRLSNAQTKQVVLAWLVGLSPSGDKVMTLRTPLGLLLNKGIVVQVDDNPHLVMTYRTCVQTFCEAVHALNAALLNTLRGGASARVQLQNLQEQPVNINVSLKGFSKAFDILDEELEAN
jgi:invasion protein IalB